MDVMDGRVNEDEYFSSVEEEAAAAAGDIMAAIASGRGEKHVPLNSEVIGCLLQSLLCP